MQQNKFSEEVADEELDLHKLFRIIWHGKLVIIITMLIFTSFGIFYTLSLPDIYKSEVLLAPVSQDSGLKIPGQLGGLAALAGVNLGGVRGEKTELAIEILKSRQFIIRFIEKYDLFVPIMAAEGWNSNDNSLVINSDIYESDTKLWVREVKPPYNPKPSALETYEVFMESLEVTQDKASGMVTFSILHLSPFLAKDWASLLVTEINDEMRSIELTEAQDSISYLNQQIEQTSIADVRKMLFSLIEEQSKTIMLANVREEYIFKTVDPAIVPEKKIKPARALLVLLISFIGVVLSFTLVLLQRILKNKQRQ